MFLFGVNFKGKWAGRSGLHTRSQGALPFRRRLLAAYQRREKVESALLRGRLAQTVEFAIAVPSRHRPTIPHTPNLTLVFLRIS
jgi:hypothetical protein